MPCRCLLGQSPASSAPALQGHAKCRDGHLKESTAGAVCPLYLYLYLYFSHHCCRACTEGIKVQLAP